MGNGIKKVNLDNIMNDVEINNIQKSNVQSHNMARGVIEAVGDILTQGSTDEQQAKIAEVAKDDAKISYDSQGNAIVDNGSSIYTIDRKGVIRKKEFFNSRYNSYYNEPTHEIIEYDVYGNKIKEIREYDYDADRCYDQKIENEYSSSTGEITKTTEYYSDYKTREVYYKNGKINTEYSYLQDGSYSCAKYNEFGRIEQIKYYDKNGKSISESEYKRKRERERN